MSNRQHLFRNACVALVIAAGFGLAWGALVAWTGNLIIRGQGTSSVSEFPRVDSRGNLLIDSNTLGPRTVRTFRTLDGQQAHPAENTSWLRSAWLVGPIPGNAPRRRAFWLFRIASYWDGRRPGTLWYFLHDGYSDGTGYFVGYDGETRRRVGYIGRSGFRADRPPKPDQFPIKLRGAFLSFHVAFSQRRYQNFLEPNVLWFGSADSDAFPLWKLHLCLDDRVLAINLRDRTVQQVFQANGLTGIGLIERAEVSGLLASEATPTELQQFLAVRLPDRVLVMNSDGTEQRTYRLPEQLRDVPVINFYELSPKTALLWVYPQIFTDGYNRHSLYWLDRTGRTLRERQVTLKVTSRPGPTLNSTLTALKFPSPLILTVDAAIGNLLRLLSWGLDETSEILLLRSITVFWPRLVVVSLLAAALAWLCARHARRRQLPSPGFWTAFVFLFGLPGFVGYLFHRSWPVLEACPRCERVVPRDREVCAACGESFPEPEPTGCEVFA